MRKIFIITFILVLSIEAICGILPNRLIVMPDVTSNKWDFSNFENNSKDGDELIYSYFAWHNTYARKFDYSWYETFPDYSMDYYKHGDTIFLDKILCGKIRIEPATPVYTVRGLQTDMPFVAVNDSIHIQGKYSGNPEIDGTIIFSKNYSLPARMSVERMDFVVQKTAHPDSVINTAEADTLPHYTITTYRWMIDDHRDDPAATMRIVEEKDKDGHVFRTSTVAYSVKEEWLSGIWRAEPRDIDVISAKDGAFTFYLPGGCEPAEVDIEVTNEAGNMRGKSHISMEPGKSYRMKFKKISKFTPGIYYITISVNGSTYKKTAHVKNV